MIKIVKVRGLSMSPEYLPGDYLLVLKRPFLSLKTGDNVIFEREGLGNLVKKVDKLSSKDAFLIGSHPSSVDSRHFGEIPIRSIEGKVIYHIKKA